MDFCAFFSFSSFVVPFICLPLLIRGMAATAAIDAGKPSVKKAPFSFRADNAGAIFAAYGWRGFKAHPLGVGQVRTPSFFFSSSRLFLLFLSFSSFPTQIFLFVPPFLPEN